MKNKQVRELAALMKEMGLTKLEYDNDGTSIRMERAAAYAPAAPIAAAYPTPEATQEHQEQQEGLTLEGVLIVKSPMVGVFYAAPGADKPPYVKVGDTIHAGDVLCIIESMKIMNEITAPQDGTITEVCTANRQVVEYGQPLFRIDTTAN